MDGHFDIFHIDCKNCIVCLKRPKTNRGGGGGERGEGLPIFLKKSFTVLWAYKLGTKLLPGLNCRLNYVANLTES